MNWDLTGNHYLCFSRIARSTGAIHSINVMHRGLDGLVEWTGGRDEDAPALLSPRLRVDGADAVFGESTWDRIERWIPRFRARVAEDLSIAVTYCAPGGWQTLVRGGFLRFEIESTGSRDRTVDVTLEGTWALSLRCVASTRPLSDQNRLTLAPDGRALALEAGEGGSGAALAITATGEVRVEAASHEMMESQGRPIRFRITRTLRVRAHRRTAATFALGVAPERDGALATARAIAGMEANDMLHAGRLEITRVARRGGPAGLGELIGRNTLFAYYCALGRAIDDDRIYPVSSRAPQYTGCAVIDEAEVLYWTVPFLTRVDPYLARELLVRMFDQYSDRAGNPARYLGGGVLDPGFALDRFCGYVIAADRYITEGNDPDFVNEPLFQDVLREMDDFLWGRLHRDIFLCSTERLPSGDRAEYPYVAYDNALVWRFCQALDRLWQPRPEEPPARFRGGAEEIAAAFWQHCTAEHAGMRVIAGATDLNGNAAIYDDPRGTLRLLPSLGFCHVEDPLWTDTMELLHSEAYPLWLGNRAFPGLASRAAPGQASFVALCAQLLGPGRAQALELLRRLELDAGVACRAYDPDTGRVADGPFAAAVAAFLVRALLDGEPEKEKRHSRRSAMRT